MAKVRRSAAAAAKVPERPREIVGEVRKVPIDAIAPHPENARRGNVAAIKKSIQENGYYGTILVWAQKKLIVVGSHRWRARKELGFEDVRAEFVELTERQARKILAADNRASDLAGYDDEGLSKLLARLQKDGDLSAANYSDGDVAAVLKKLEPPAPPGEFKNLEPGGMHLARKCPSCGFEF